VKFLNREGRDVRAEQFKSGSRVPKVEQKWDREGAYYAVVIEAGEFRGRQVRLSRGDWVCFSDQGLVIDVQQNGTFLDEHVEVREEPKKTVAAKPAIVSFTTADLEAEKRGEELEAPQEPSVEMPKAKRGRKKKPVLPTPSVGKLPPLPRDDLELL
jgi:hypothetical protein